MNIDTIALDINGYTYCAEVEFKYTPGQQAVLDRLPDDCYEGIPEDWDLHKLTIEDSGEDVSVILELDYVYADIIDQLKVIRDA